MSFNSIKRFITKQIVEQLINYIEKNPEENFLKVLNLVDKATNTEKVHSKISRFRKSFKTNPATQKYIKKFTKLAPSYQQKLVMNFFINSGLIGIPRQQKAAEKLGVNVPWAILIDPTSACNLNCEGCWAGKYDKSNNLDFDTIDRIITEAKELGIYFIAFSGGEPTIYPHLFEIFEKHNDVAFMMYTNGTLIDEEMADRMLEVGNISPAISLEGSKKLTDERRGSGTYDKIIAAMDRLQKRNILFGVSVTVTRNNIDELFSNDDFIDSIIEKGASYVWSFHYVPVGKDPDLSLMITPEQRAMLAERIPELRSQKPIFIADFWNDGTFTGGCIAGGRHYFHINSKGDVEPCAFAHFATDNIKQKSLKEVLQNPLFKSYQEHQPFNDNLMSPCPIIDNPEALRNMVKETEAYPTHPDADTVLKGEVAKQLDDLSENWNKISKSIHQKRMEE